MTGVRGDGLSRWHRALSQSGPTAVPAALLTIPVVALLAVGWDWPWRLGFFADDWMILMHPAPGSWQAWKDLFSLVSNRPASAPLYWLAQVLAGWSPSRAQVLNLVAWAITAAAVGTLTACVLRKEETTTEQRLAAAVATATIYVLLPWNVAMFSWSVSMLAAAPATALFCCGMAILISPRSHSVTGRFGAYFLLAASHLAYEAFYLQGVCILLLAAALQTRRIDRRLAWQIVAVVALALSCLAYNRLMPGVIHKGISADWLATFVQGHRRLPQMIADTLRERWTTTAIASLVFVVAGCAGLASRIGLLRLAVIGAIAVLGVAGSGLLYALAGYGLGLKGIMARTAMALGLYVSLVAGLLVLGLLTARRHRGYLLVTGAACLAVAVTGLQKSSRERVAEWAAVWAYETRRIASMPLDLVPVGGDRRVFVLHDSYETEAIHAATAPWEVAGLVAYSFYTRAGVRPMEFAGEGWSARPRMRWLATRQGWWTRWDGRNLAQAPCGSSAGAYIAQGESLLVWQRDRRTMQTVASGWEIGCQR